MAELEHVPEQHHPLDFAGSVKQRPAQLLAAQQVGARATAEVQVGDD